VTDPSFEAKRSWVSSTITSQPLWWVCALNKAKDGISESISTEIKRRMAEKTGHLLATKPSNLHGRTLTPLIKNKTCQFMRKRGEHQANNWG
jgi:hypothetical protein